MTCTLLEESVADRGRRMGRKRWAAITVTIVYRLVQGSRSQSCIKRGIVMVLYHCSYVVRWWGVETHANEDRQGKPEGSMLILPSFLF